MRIVILGAADGWHVGDLLRAAAELGHDASVLPFAAITCQVGLEAASPPFDAALVRTMPLGSLEQVIFRMDALHGWQAAGVRILNPPLALETCIDKFLTCLRLERAGLPVPPTLVCQNADEALLAFQRLGSDVVVKPLFGSEGRGLMRVSDPELAWRTFRTLERQQAVLYLQRFVAHPGWDLRVFVLGERILAAMRRHACQGWRTNVAQGGQAEPAFIGDLERDLALRAGRATGAIAAGVDLLPRPEGGWYVLEVNAVPGWRALSRVCQIDVAKEIIKSISDSCK